MRVRHGVLVGATCVMVACQNSPRTNDQSAACGGEGRWLPSDTAPPNRVMVTRVKILESGMQVDGSVRSDVEVSEALTNISSLRPSPYVMVSQLEELSCQRIEDAKEIINASFDCSKNYCVPT